MLTIDDLRRILTEVAGQDEEVDLSGRIEDIGFEDLGYDSLALMETAARIEQEFGVRIEDEDVVTLETPAALLALVNSEPAA